MTLPWFILMILGLCFCLKYKEWKSMILWSWFVGFMVFITFVNWNYHVQYLFPVMPACYFFSLYGVSNIYDWIKKRLKGKVYFPALRIVGLVVLLAWPTVNLVSEIQSLRSDFYRNKVTDQIVTKVKELTGEKNKSWYLGEFYPMYQPGEQIHPQDWFYKIYHLGANALSFLSARKIHDIPDHTFYLFSKFIKKGDTLIYYPGINVSSKFIPAPEKLPPIYVGKIEPSVFVLNYQSEKNKSFMTQDGSSEIQLTSIDDSHMVIDLKESENKDSSRIFWFKLDHRIINSEVMGRIFIKFKAKEKMVLPADIDYFERIREITLLSYDAEEFRESQ